MAGLQYSPEDRALLEGILSFPRYAAARTVIDYFVAVNGVDPEGDTLDDYRWNNPDIGSDYSDYWSDHA